MKNLKEFVGTNESLEHIGNSVKKWIKIRNIFDHLHITLNEQLLLEGSGLFSGCYDIAKFLNEKIFSTDKNEITISSKDIPVNIEFTDEIRLKIYRDEPEVHSSYKFADIHDKEYNDKRWNKSKFNWIDLSVYLKKDTKSFVEMLIHELDHAYDDYNQYKHNGTTYEYKYIKSNYKFFDSEENDDDFTRIVKAINYVFIKFETHAYIVQVRGEIDRKFNTVSEAYDFIEKNSSTWKQLKIVKNNAEAILRDEKLSKMYCDVFKKITGTKKDNDKILSELEKKLDKYWKKVINHIYLMLAENSINESAMTLAPASKHFIDELKTKE